jgi:hypothetical protein
MSHIQPASEERRRNHAEHDHRDDHARRVVREPHDAGDDALHEQPFSL